MGSVAESGADCPRRGCVATARKESEAPVARRANSDCRNGVGAAIFLSACQGAMTAGAPPFGGLNLHLSTAVNAPNPQNIINVTLFGLPAAEGEPSAIMPAFPVS